MSTSILHQKAHRILTQSPAKSSNAPIKSEQSKDHFMLPLKLVNNNSNYIILSSLIYVTLPFRREIIDPNPKKSSPIKKQPLNNSENTINGSIFKSNLPASQKITSATKASRAPLHTITPSKRNNNIPAKPSTLPKTPLSATKATNKLSQTNTITTPSKIPSKLTKASTPANKSTNKSYAKLTNTPTSHTKTQSPRKPASTTTSAPAQHNKTSPATHTKHPPHHQPIASPSEQPPAPRTLSRSPSLSLLTPTKSPLLSRPAVRYPTSGNKSHNSNLNHSNHSTSTPIPLHSTFNSYESDPQSGHNSDPEDEDEEEEEVGVIDTSHHSILSAGLRHRYDRPTTEDDDECEQDDDEGDEIEGHNSEGHNSASLSMQQYMAAVSDDEPTEGEQDVHYLYLNRSISLNSTMVRGLCDITLNISIINIDYTKLHYNCIIIYIHFLRIHYCILHMLYYSIYTILYLYIPLYIHIYRTRC